MNKRPGHVTVTTEVGYCNFCQRTRNLRREQHQLGQLVRTIVACETCHRTLSSTIGVAAPPAAEPVKEEAPVVEAAAATQDKSKAKVADEPKPKRAPAKRKPATAAKARPKTPAKPRSTATRHTTRKK